MTANTPRHDKGPHAVNSWGDVVDNDNVWSSGEAGENRLAQQKTPQVVETKPWSPEPAREKVRGWLIYLLVGLTSIITVWLLLFLTLGYPTEVVNTGLTGLFTPVLTTLGVGIGFYFGEKSSKAR